MAALTFLVPFALVAAGAIAAATLGPAPREPKLRRLTALTVGAVALLILGTLAFVVLDDQVGLGYRGFAFAYPLLALLFAVVALVPFVVVHWLRRRRAA